MPERVDASVRERLRERRAELPDSPEQRGQRLKDSTFWRLRIGDFRTIYEIDTGQGKVIILFIGHRSDVYDDFSRML